MSKSISVRIDDRLWPYIKTYPNKSALINELLKAHIQQNQSEAIYDAVSSRLLQDDAWLTSLRNKLSQSPYVGRSSKPLDDTLTYTEAEAVA